MCSQTRLVRLDVVGAEDVIVRINGDECGSRHLDPGLMSFLFGNIGREWISLTSSKDWFDDPPNRWPILLFKGLDVDHLLNHVGLVLNDAVYSWVGCES